MASVFSKFFGLFSGGGVRTTGVQTENPVSGRLTKKTVQYDNSLQLSAVFACTRLISETIGCLPFNLYRLGENGERTLDLKHPIARLLNRKPNRYQTRVEFFQTLVMQLCMHGNAYIKIEYAGNEIISLLPLMSSQVEVAILDNGDVSYKYTNGKDVAIYSRQSIWHVKLFGNGVIGLSPLGYARNAIGIAISSEERVSSMANNGFKPTGVLMIDKTLTADQRQKIRASFSDLSEGGEDSLRLMEAGMTYQQISLNPKDVQLLETRRFQLEDIARFMGVPSVLINDTAATTVWGSGIQQIVQGFYKLGLRPYLEMIEESARIWLLSLDDQSKYEFAFDFDALLRGDTDSRYSTYEKAVRNGLRTINECRRDEGDSPIEGGDKPYMQMQMVPVGEHPTVPNSGA